ncbi:hypothetical protein UY3_03160 [Chelonia mydas]|uniref:Uncharacterized protein n=1 Tax=Chelonia mydas TaxID=8469 RepID=M7BQR6_CHEMY|nr:hypothetical protein UY3_03160 [Chelonia mydas]
MWSALTPRLQRCWYSTSASGITFAAPPLERRSASVNEKTVVGAKHPAAEMLPQRSSSGKKREIRQRFSAAFWWWGVLRVHKNAPAGAMAPVGTALGTPGLLVGTQSGELRSVKLGF